MAIVLQLVSRRGTVPFAVRWNSWTLGAISLICLVLAVPYFLTHDFAVLGFALQRGFALVCHQRPERCFWIFGAPVAVCARCLGIYVGAAIGLVMRTSRSVAMRLLIVATLINALDAVTELAGLHGNWMDVRFALGLMLGAAGALLISSAGYRTANAAKVTISGPNKLNCAIQREDSSGAGLEKPNGALLSKL